MRIAVFHNLPSGGAKRALLEMIRGLSRKNRVDVFTLSSADHDFCDLRPWAHRHRIYEFASLRLYGSPWGRLNPAVRWSDLRRLERVAAVVGQDVDPKEYDVLFAHPCQFEGCPSILRFAGVPSVYYCQEAVRKLFEPAPPRPYDACRRKVRRTLDVIDPLPKLYQSRLRRTDMANMQAADRVLVNSIYTKDTIARLYHLGPFVAHLGVDTTFFRPNGSARRPFVFSVGSLTPMKAFDFLIEAVALISRPQRPPVAIASNFENPPERAYLLQLAASRQVELELLGSVTDERLMKLYNEASVVAYTPIREPFGLVTLEAMACETPVVAVNEGGVRETVVHEQTGLLVERELALFAKALQHLLADPMLARKYGCQGRELVLRQWSWQPALSALEDHLRATRANSQ